MRLFLEPERLAPGTAAVLGAFDGLHRGHQALLRRALERCPRVAMVTFEPHPAEVLAPERAPARLQSPGQRARVAEALGIDTLVLLTFDHAVASTSPEDFVTRYLLEGLAPEAVVVGADFRYGSDRAGDTESLAAQLAAAGVELIVVEQVNDADGQKLGSSEIRAAVRAGDVDKAAEILGYLYPVTGRVRHGAARGRQLGFRTANIESDCLVPARGVYAGWMSVHGGGGGGPWPAVANVGHNPTFADGAATTTGVEVHAIDLDLGESLYEREVEFSFACRLRDELTFDGADALIAAIEDDIARGRGALAEPRRAADRCRPASLRGIHYPPPRTDGAPS